MPKPEEMRAIANEICDLVAERYPGMACVVILAAADLASSASNTRSAADSARLCRFALKDYEELAEHMARAGRV